MKRPLRDVDRPPPTMSAQTCLFYICTMYIVCVLLVNLCQSNHYNTSFRIEELGVVTMKFDISTGGAVRFRVCFPECYFRAHLHLLIVRMIVHNNLNVVVLPLVVGITHKYLTTRVSIVYS